MGLVRRSPRIRDRAIELGLSREDIQLITYAAGSDGPMVRSRVRDLRIIFRELSKLGSIDSQRAWLHGEHCTSKGELPPLTRLKTENGLRDVWDHVFCMLDMQSTAEDLFPYDLYPALSLWNKAMK